MLIKIDYLDLFTTKIDLNNSFANQKNNIFIKNLINMSIGENVKTKRLKLNISQEVLAEKLHVSQATLSNIESNKSVPDIILLQQIADMLDTNINDLLDTERIIINNNNQKGGVGYAEIVNQLSENLIKQYEKRIMDKNEEILYLKNKLNKLEDKLLS